MALGCCNYTCTCDDCWNQPAGQCGHTRGTCSRTPLEAFNEALAKGQVAVIDSLDDSD